MPSTSAFHNPQPHRARKSKAHREVDTKFPTETAAQKALHLDIAVKYDKQRRRRRAWPDDLDPGYRPNLVLNLRMADLERLFLDNWQGGIIQDDDAGRDDVYIAAQHIAQHGAPEQRIPAWLRIWPHRGPSTRPHRRHRPSHGRPSASAGRHGTGEAGLNPLRQVRHVTKVRGQ